MVRYVPAEILSGYTVIFSGAVAYAGGGSSTKGESPASEEAQVLGSEVASTGTVEGGLFADVAATQWFAVGLIVLFLIVTFAYIQRNEDPVSLKSHRIVTPIAFLAWAYPISSALLGTWFHGLIALGLQAIVIALALVIAPARARSA